MTQYKRDIIAYKDPFTDWFRDMLKASKKTLKEIETETGIRSTALRYYRTGARSPSLKNARLIAGVFGKEITFVDRLAEP